MKFWYSTDHDSHWPVGAASIVAAEHQTEASFLLYKALVANGLDPGKGFTLHELKPGEAKVLVDGNY